MKASEILLAAKDQLLDRGWCQMAQVDLQGRVCLQSAVWFVEFNCRPPRKRSVEFDTARKALANACVQRSTLNDHPVFWARDIAAFNDHPDTTFRDALDVIDEAVRSLKDRGL